MSQWRVASGNQHWIILLISIFWEQLGRIKRSLKWLDHSNSAINVWTDKQRVKIPDFLKKNISKKYDTTRLADSIPLLFYWHFKVCTEWAQISKAKTRPDKVRKYFVLNVIMLSWQHSLASVMCYILSNTSQKGRQIETNCPWGWTFHYFVTSVCIASVTQGNQSFGSILAGRATDKNCRRIFQWSKN